MVREPKIISCDQWGARPPKSGIVRVDRPDRIIIHHTDGHGQGTSEDADKQYARAIQNFHMDANGWIDSGHNFLVTRQGRILEGRHGSVRAIDAGQMVSSAHCPGQNDQPGIEHEHLPGEKITDKQQQASVDLCAWICDRTGIKPTSFRPHSDYYATACPDNLKPWIPVLTKNVAAVLKPGPPAPSDHQAELLWRLWAFGEGKYAKYDPFEGPRPNVIAPAPREWYIRAIKFLCKRTQKPPAPAA